MKIEKIIFNGSNGIQLPGILWLPDSRIQVLLQISHGMTEHIGRYETLAQELTAQGIAVAGFDLRGHGQNPGLGACASFGEGGWEASLEDMHLFYEYLDEKFSGLPHFMLGFSLGSFLLREYLNRYNDDVAGAVIMGTGHQPGIILSVMRMLVKTQIKQNGFDNTTDLVRKLSFETYNQKFAQTRTKSDWLCADEKQLTLYLLDPFCREDISSGLFWELLGSMKRTGNRHAYDHWKKDMPILLLSGRDDPVGDFGKGVQCVKMKMEKAGLKEISIHIFSGARHDLLHEEENGCASKVRTILKDWMLQKA